MLPSYLGASKTWTSLKFFSALYALNWRSNVSCSHSPVEHLYLWWVWGAAGLEKLHEDLRRPQDSFSRPLRVRSDLWGQTAHHPDTQEYNVTGHPHPHPLHLLHRGCRGVSKVSSSTSEARLSWPSHAEGEDRMFRHQTSGNIQSHLWQGCQIPTTCTWTTIIFLLLQDFLLLSGSFSCSFTTKFSKEQWDNLI